MNTQNLCISINRFVTFLEKYPFVATHLDEEEEEENTADKSSSELINRNFSESGGISQEPGSAPAADAIVLLEDELFGGLEFGNNLHILAELDAARGSSAIAVAVIDEVSTIVFHEVVHHNR